MAEMKYSNIRKINDFKWEIICDKSAGMKVPGIIFADEEILENAVKEKTIVQVINVANLPGILNASYAMPDIHFGYGFCIGGVAATDAEDGVISPGGVGFDIACGVRLLRTNIEASEIKPVLQELTSSLYTAVPKGVGKSGRIKLSSKEIKKIFKEGVNWGVKNGYGWEEDKYFTEEEGCMHGGNPDYVSRLAINRGSDQVGSLGSGNHFIEIQKVSQIYNEKAACAMGIHKGQVLVMIHSGSRGLGHQVCSDYLKIMQGSLYMNKIKLPDRQLACAPLKSDEGRRYFSAMVCAVNFAMVNRHCLAHWVRNVFESFFSKSAEKLGMSTLYDVSHNIAKIENHLISNNTRKDVCVHRKGATRAFGPGAPQVPQIYKEIGQPVIVPGDMGRYSFIMTGTQTAMHESFGSTCHGAGRLMSRSKAKKVIDPVKLKNMLFDSKGIIIFAQSLAGLAEEAPDAYKDVEKVVEIAQSAKISDKVAKLEPLSVIKG
ncbi:MAG: RtcB family protein [Actinobacteria bacterium]|nr:RtcB family protein [Actinomycetota bacterium]